MAATIESASLPVENKELPSHSAKAYDGLNDVVSSSSCTFAAYRAVESECDGALFRDPLAADLAGPQALEIVRAKVAENVQRRHQFAVRTRWFDDAICRALRPPTTTSDADLAEQVACPPAQPPAQEELTFPSFQVVMFGCGMDARAWRLPAPGDGTHTSWLARAVYEIDFADVMGVKAAVLEKLRESGRLPPLALAPVRHGLAVDLLLEDWRTALKAAGFTSLLPTVWVMEGVLMYLTPEVVNSLLTAITELSTPGSSIVASGVSQGAVDRYGGNKDWANTLVGTWKMGTDDPEGLFASFGWTTVSKDSTRGVLSKFGLPIPERLQGDGKPGGAWYIHVKM